MATYSSNSTITATPYYHYRDSGTALETLYQVPAGRWAEVIVVEHTVGSVDWNFYTAASQLIVNAPAKDATTKWYLGPLSFIQTQRVGATGRVGFLIIEYRATP